MWWRHLGKKRGQKERGWTKRIEEGRDNVKLDGDNQGNVKGALVENEE